MLMRTSLLLVLLFNMATAWSAEQLLHNVSYQNQDDHVQLELRLGVAVQIEEFLIETDQQVRLVLKPTGADAPSNWSSTEMQFTEPDRILESVSIEGSKRRGFELFLTFNTPISAQLLPQFDDHQVLIKLARTREFRKLARFGKVKEGDPYVINLESRQRSVPGIEDIPKAFSDSHTIYLIDHEQDKVLWHRLRLGFFPDAGSAERTAKLLSRYYPDAWVAQVSDKETRFAEAFRINPVNEIAKVTGQMTPSDPVSKEVQLDVRVQTPESIAVEPATTVTASPWTSRPETKAPAPTEIEALLAEARSAFEMGDHDRAITLYTKLLNVDDESARQQATEMLGVARELNGQLAHAKRYYQEYLERYPDTAGAPRGQQRLSTLLALERPLQTASRSEPLSKPRIWRLGAQLSQFYQHHSLKVGDRSTVPINGVFNDFNLLARRNGASLDQELRITTSYLLDFTDNERLKGREFQISTAYWEGMSDRFNSELRIGRQSRWDSGALGRFDGASFTYRATQKLALGFTGGYLIDSSFDAPNSNRPFFGISSEYLSDSGNLSVKPFYIQQNVDGLLDRQALGLQSQLHADRFMLFSLIDYDLHHSALNNFTAMGDFRLGRSNLAASFEHRKNPYLTTRNALMGQGFEDLSALEEAILDLSLEEIANDRTATSNTLRLGWHTKLNDRWTLSTDVVASEFSKTEASVDVPGLEAHRAIYSSFQLRSSELFGRGTYSAVMLRYADSTTSGTTSVYWDNRFVVGDRWRFYPRMRVDHRSFARNGDQQWSLRPSLRMDYRLGRRIRFELEGGYQWTTREMATQELDISGVFMRAGYRASF